MNISLNIQGRPQELVSVLTALSGLAESQSDSIQVPIAMPAETAKPVAKSLPKQAKAVTTKEEVTEVAEVAEEALEAKPVKPLPVQEPVAETEAAQEEVAPVAKSETVATDQPENRVTVEMARKLVQAKAAEGKKDNIKKILDSIGASSVSTVSKEDLPQFYALISAL